MKKLLWVSILLLLSLTLNAEETSYQMQQQMKKINYAQKIFRKKLQRKCGYTASHWAQQHTKQEWESFQSKGMFKNELAHMCPKGMKVVKDKWMEPLYLFATEYAKDTGNRPRC